jgi:2'-5' RNA ligase
VETRRLFVAAWLGEAARGEAAALAKRLRADGASPSIRWVDPANLHVTLRFLGDVAGDRVEGLVRSLERSLRGAAPFEYRLGGVGTFPSPAALRRGRDPRVLWAALETGGPELARLASRVERAVMAAGVSDAIDDRPFRAHVTLGRFRSRPRGLDRTIRLLEEVEFRGRAHFFEEVTLAESRLTPRGAMYETVESLPLTEGAAPDEPLPREGDSA